MEQNGKELVKIKVDGGVLDYNDRATLQVLRAQYMNLTEAEFANFLSFCVSTALNPFKREIWAIKGNPYTNKQGQLVHPPVQIMVGFNGYLTTANRHSQFDGMQTTVERENGKAIAATTTVYRKDRAHPSTVTVFMEEFYKPGFNGKPSTWDKMPVVMLTKVAKSHAIREAFPVELGGTYTPEEMPPEYSAKVIDVEVSSAPVDDIPESWKEPTQPAERPKTFYVYDISGVAAEHHSKAVQVLKKVGATTEDELLMRWESPARVQKLEKYLIEGA